MKEECLSNGCNYQVLKIVFSKVEDRFSTTYTRCTTYYCTRCLSEINKLTEATKSVGERKPDWYEEKK